MQAGRDVVACLNEAMERLGLDMRVSALVCFSHYNTIRGKVFGLMEVTNLLQIDGE